MKKKKIMQRSSWYSQISQISTTNLKQWRI